MTKSMVLQHLEPARVFNYFEEISAIPRGSGNRKPMADYLKQFAERLHLEYEIDAHSNILIRKPATPGYEESPGVILQGHTDMVCVKNEDTVIDFTKDGIPLCTDGKTIWADGTSLGADDGIAIAYMLSLLASDDIEHPMIEALFTVDEEIGLLGATAFDASIFKGTRLINLDSEDEGILTISCAGGVRAMIALPVEQESASGITYTLTLENLCGGHSGTEIDKGKSNAIKLLGRYLTALSDKFPIRLVSVDGGVKENAIPSEANAVFCIPADCEDALLSFADTYHHLLLHELSASEPSLTIILKKTDAAQRMFTETATRQTIFMLYHIPNGMQRMNPHLPGMVQTSLNAGILYFENNTVYLKYSIRSSITSEKAELKQRLSSFISFLGGSIEFMAEYPAWEYRPDSQIREISITAFENIYGRQPQVLAIHAGLECGIFAGNNSTLDCISFGPSLKNVHTPEESMDVKSVRRTWNLLLEILRLCE